MTENDTQDPTQAVLETALAFANALIAHREPVPHEFHNVLTFPALEIDAALKGQVTLLENHAEQLKQALLQEA